MFSLSTCMYVSYRFPHCFASSSFVIHLTPVTFLISSLHVTWGNLLCHFISTGFSVGYVYFLQCVHADSILTHTAQSTEKIIKYLFL